MPLTDSRPHQPALFADDSGVVTRSRRLRGHPNVVVHERRDGDGWRVTALVHDPEGGR